MTEQLGWQSSLEDGEIGIQAPTKVTTTGPDYITYAPKLKLIKVWDAKYRSTGRFPSTLSPTKLTSWKSRISDAVKGYSGPYAPQIQQALDQWSVGGFIFPYGG